MRFLNRTFAIGLITGCLLSSAGILAFFFFGFLYYRDNPNGRIITWGKDFIKGTLHNHHPLAQIHNYIQEVKSNIRPTNLQSISTFSKQQVGFSGSRVEKSGQLISWIAPFSDRIPPDEKPPSSLIGKQGSSAPITLIGLRGETLSLQVVIRSPASINNLELSFQPLNLAAAPCIKTHRFLEIYMKLMVHKGGKHGPLVELVNPDPLVPFTDPYNTEHKLITRFNTERNKNLPIWVDVHFSRACSAQSYKGILRITEAGKTIRETPVHFIVLNVTLPRNVGLDRWMELYTTRFWKGEMIPNDQAFQKLLHRYFQVAHNYGFSTNPCGDIGPNIRWDWNTGTPLSVDWTYYDQVMGPELSGELTGKTPESWCLPIPEYTLGVNNWGGFTTRNPSPSPIENWEGLPDIATQNLARLLVQHWKEKNWPISHAFVYTFDEPSHLLYYYPDTYKLIADVADSLHKGSHNKIRFMLTDTPWVWGKEQHGHDKSVIYDKIDIWSPSGSTYIPDRVWPYQKKGRTFWFYQSGPPFTASGDLSSTGIGFRMWFWTAWKYKSNGVFFWASDFWHGNTRATNPYTNGGNGDGEIFYPGHQLHFLGYDDINGPVPSIRMAQWRRGYEDYKYFYLLKKMRDGKFADLAVDKMVKRALDDGGYIPYWRNPLWWKPGDWNHDPKAWHKLRVSLAKEIDRVYSH